MAVAATCVLQHLCLSTRDGGFPFSGPGVPIANDAIEGQEAPPHVTPQVFGTISVLDFDRINSDGQQRANCVGQDMALWANNLLAGIVAGRVEASVPLKAQFAVWLSMIAVVGLA